MKYPILTTSVSSATVVTLRDRTRQVSELFGLEKLESTRFTTAVSEIARNVVQFATEGTVTFHVDTGVDAWSPQSLVAEMRDQGPGIADIDAVLEGRYDNGRPDRPLGIVGSRRLVDSLTIACPPAGGTVVEIRMELPRSAPRLESASLAGIADQLARRKPRTALEELEKQNREMMDALHELRQKQVELEKADERKNQFLTTLAHELRNPLGTLHMTLELIKRKPQLGDAERASRHEVMSRQTAQITALVDDLLDVSRVARGKVELALQDVDLNQLVLQAVEITGAAVRDKQHAVRVARWNAPLMVAADPHRLKQVIVNLVHNAARYTPAGGHIELTVSREGASARLDVTDNGQGIEADALPHIFDLFVQGRKNGGDEGGLGVGLTLVKRLVEGHGGTVEAASAGAGRGARFSVSLPLANAGGAANGPGLG